MVFLLRWLWVVFRLVLLSCKGVWGLVIVCYYELVVYGVYVVYG